VAAARDDTSALLRAPVVRTLVAGLAADGRTAEPGRQHERALERRPLWRGRNRGRRSRGALRRSPGRRTR
jgi:hypothetical protein